VEQLERVDLSMSEDNMKLAFWINVYNSLIMHVMPDIAVTLLCVFLMILLPSFSFTCRHI
jgi:hypothetical protein